MGRMTLSGPVFRERLQSAFETTIERTQDFTDSAYTSHEHREKMLLICDRTKQELNQLLRIAVSIVSSLTALSCRARLSHSSSYS